MSLMCNKIRNEVIEETATMRRSNRRSQKLDLNLNLSLLPTRVDTPRWRLVADEASPHRCKSSPSSCLSSEADLGLRSPTSPDTAASMVLAGCPRCLMYVMLSEDELKCPMCNNTVLLDFFHGATATTTAKNNKHSNKKTRMS
ncbi:hypothetical protein MUK42_15447 [Musa troglodytarum]|uniref:GIR1-like zinc ribbon domain-containing protein n=1 Tax=Musa troglodytarum TaxID=320322 RepID=A0A9E7H5R8_9LILI|nr:hypothetical protein MUK42_15447 [Musa troglodytarum]